MTCYQFSSTYSAPVARIERSALDSELVSNIGKTLSHAVNFNSNIVSSVSALHIDGGPNAILFAVPKIVVNTLNRVMRRWLGPHVMQKHAENIPATIDANASTTIIFKPYGVAVVAPRSDVLPDDMLGGTRLTVRSAQSTNSISLSAPARLHAAINNFCPNGNDLIPTITRRKPICFLVADRIKFYYCQTVEFLSSKVKSFGHNEKSYMNILQLYPTSGIVK
jgi:hypothetical protein